MKGTRLKNLTVVAVIVLLCVLAIYAQTAARSAGSHATNAPQKKAGGKSMANKDHPFGQPTQIHIVPAGCRAQEPMVHANGSDETPPGKVTFFSPSDITLTFSPKGVLQEDNPAAGTITIYANQPKTVNVLAKAGFGQVVTQYRIGDCNPPSHTAQKDKKEHQEDLSDPNDIIVP